MSDGETLTSDSGQQPQTSQCEASKAADSKPAAAIPAPSSDSSTTNNNIPSSGSKPRADNVQKTRFALFVKILFKQLERSPDTTPELRDMAKSIVLDCTRRNRLRDPEYVPLMDAVDRRLRRHVGEAHWRRAQLYTQQYMMREACRNKAGLPVTARVAMV